MNNQILKLASSRDVRATDYLLKITKGATVIESDHDWMVLGKVFEFWTRRWPQEWKDYVESMEMIKQTRLNKQGYSASKEIKYVGALPGRFERLIRTLFPLQPIDKKFVYELTKRIKVTKVGEKTDTWFVI